MAAGAECGCPGTKGSSRGRKDKGHLGDEGRRASAERLPGRWAGAGCGLRRPPQRGPPRGTKQRRRARSLQRGPAPRRAPGARAREHARQRRRLEMAVGAEEGAGAGSGALWLGSAPAPPGIREPAFKLLGFLDVENIPCARDSILYGSLGSIVAGFGHFLFTSRIKRSCDVGVGGFILVTLGCWFHCRYNYAKQRIRERIAREEIKKKILYEGTHLDPERKHNSNSSN
nr:cytochrome c oxidase assembly protein COX20, mitochondrial isoform X1 [Macaca fascicularis]